MNRLARPAGADKAPLEPISVRIPDAVRLTGLSRSRLYELMRDGEIEFVKVGGSTLVLVESLRAFIEGRRADRSRGSGAAEASAPLVR